MTYRILQFPKDERLLRRVAKHVKVEEFGTEPLYEFRQNLAKTMYANRGLVLAATQVAEEPAGHAWRGFCLAVQRDGGQQVEALTCWNPVIEIVSDYQPGMEGCLSFGSIMESMPAPTVVRLAFQNDEGEPTVHTFRGLLARAAWHETHHLDGNLIIDRMGPLKKAMFLKALQKSRGRHA